MPAGYPNNSTWSTTVILVRWVSSVGAAVKVKSVQKRYKEKAFARGADRSIISECTQCGLELDEFLALALAAMQDIAPELELA